MSKKGYKKVSKRIIRLEAGQTFEGKFLKKIQRDAENPQTGEIVSVIDYLFETPEGEGVVFTGNKGFNRAFYSTDLDNGSEVMIERLSDLRVKKGSTHQFDIYVKD